MFHILIGHRNNWLRVTPAINFNIIFPDSDWTRSWFHAFVEVHPVAVETFFVIGGFLIARSMLAQLERKSFNIPKLILHRYLRTTPVLAFLIFFIVSTMKFTGDGPIWNRIIAQFSQPCKDYWWTGILHIQNYYNPNDMVSSVYLMI